MKACSDHPLCARCEAFSWLQAWWAATFSDSASISNQFGEAVPGVHESAAETVQRRFGFKRVRKVQKVQRKRARAHASGSFSDYEVIERIGAGGCGCITKAMHRLTSDLAAMKAVDDSESEADLHEEAKIMKLLNGHPNIVRLHQTVMNLGRLVVIMEYVLGVSLKQPRDLPEHMIRILFQQITDGACTG